MNIWKCAVLSLIYSTQLNAQAASLSVSAYAGGAGISPVGSFIVGSSGKQTAYAQSNLNALNSTATAEWGFAAGSGIASSHGVSFRTDQIGIYNDTWNFYSYSTSSDYITSNIDASVKINFLVNVDVFSSMNRNDFLYEKTIKDFLQDDDAWSPRTYTIEAASSIAQTNSYVMLADPSYTEDYLYKGMFVQTESQRIDFVTGTKVGGGLINNIHITESKSGSALYSLLSSVPFESEDVVLDVFDPINNNYNFYRNMSFQFNLKANYKYSLAVGQECYASVNRSAVESLGSEASCNNRGVYWNGITEIVPSSQFSNDSLKIESESGFNYLFAHPDSPLPASSPTPEPSTWAMLLIGFFAIGRASSRSKSLIRN